MNCEASEERERDKQLDKKRDFIQNGYMWNYVAKVQLYKKETGMGSPLPG